MLDAIGLIPNISKLKAVVKIVIIGIPADSLIVICDGLQ